MPDSTDHIADGRSRWVVPALLAAVVAISFAAIFLRKAEPTHALVRSGWRLLIASVLLLPMVWRGLHRGLLQPMWRWAILAGVLYGVHFGSWIWSLDYTTVAASVTLVTATPLLLAVVGVVTGKDRPGGRLWVALALGTAGVLTIGWADLSLSGRALAGDALALLGAAAMAGYLLMVRRLGSALDVWSFMGVACAVGAATQFAAAGAAGLDLVPATAESLFYIALAAVLPQLVGHVLLTWSLRHTTPSVVALTILGEPVGATLLAWVWLGETVGAVVLTGCALVLGAMALSLARGRRLARLVAHGAG